MTPPTLHRCGTPLTVATQPSPLVLSLSILLALFFFIHPAFAIDAKESLVRAIAITDATMATSFTGNDLRMYDTYNTASHQGSGIADVWPYTAALEAHCSVLEALEALKETETELYEATHDRFVTRLRQLFDNLAFYSGTYQLKSYARVASWTVYGVHRGATKGTAAVTGIENVYDDQMWIIRELVRAYRLTNDNAYLKKAEYLANYCIDGWDCCLDANGNEYGGISWGPGYNSKHSCSNGPFIQPLVWLADIYHTDDETENLRYYYILPDNSRTTRLMKHSELYLEMAKKIYAWQKEKLLDPSRGIYWDMCGAAGEIQYVKIGRTTYRDHVDIGAPVGTAYTYNSGTMLAGAAELYRITGDQTYLNDLNDLCKNTYQRFTKRVRIDNQIYREWPTDDTATEGFNTWFDNVLMRAYVDAYPYNDDNSSASTSLASFQQNLDYAWDNFRRDDLLPIHLLKGWDDGDITKGFHQCAFASEYAMLSVWMSKQTIPDKINDLKTSEFQKLRSSNIYDLNGCCTSSFRRGIYITKGKKIIIK